jgi:drug/metabolite transporter (DMT)-like permease
MPPPRPEGRTSAPAREPGAPASSPEAGGGPPASVARSGAALVAIGAACISLAPVFVRAVGGAVGYSAVAAWRGLLGAAVLAAICLARGERLTASRRAIALAALAGVLLAADFAAWHRSIARIGGGMATILGNTQVFWVALVGVVAFGEAGGRRLALAIAGGIVGVALLAGAADGAADRADPLGVFQGCLTGALYASFLLVLRHSARRAEPLSPAVRMLWVSLACGLASVAVAGATGERVVPSDGRSLAYLVGLALVAQVVGWMLITSGLPHVPVSQAGLLLLLQPTLSALWGVLLFGERLGPWQALGAAVTLAAIYVGSTAAARGAAGRASSTIP